MDKAAFIELGIEPKLLQAIEAKGFEEPTEIQKLTIPVLLRNDTDIIAQAQTGTGKTAAFGIPLLQLSNPENKSTQALVLVPTRELALQVCEEIESLGSNALKIISVYGGQPIDKQIRALKKGVGLVVGTPGRVLDLIRRRVLKLGEISQLVLDEADEMLNMGFIEDMEEIIKHTNPEKRTLLFSATMPDKIKKLADTYLKKHQFLKVEKANLTTSLTRQYYFEVKSKDKLEALCRLIDREEEFYSIIFCKTRAEVNELTADLIDRGYTADGLHGEISQAQREITLGKFRKRHVKILVATDVASRGIDVNDVSHVVNFSIPREPESYVHRIGRTGRAGQEGTAITFITPSEFKKLKFIERISKCKIERQQVPGIEEVIKARLKRYDGRIKKEIEGDISNDIYNWAKGLQAEEHPTKIIAALLSMNFKKSLDPDSYAEIRELGGSKSYEQEGDTARLFVALGKKDGFSAKKLVDMIISKVPMRQKDVQDVEIKDIFSFLTVPESKAEVVLNKFARKGQKPLVTRVKNERENKPRRKSFVKSRKSKSRKRR